ncbi:probable glutathione S-transferase [Pistacia vera]|uniref:probable glutathione S-transferase n=1 Tax=Pistacia vera TaxID=55513 RepID=UPI00126304AE|nr:probable glutathione S-transferase [Pistacia vera]
MAEEEEEEEAEEEVILLDYKPSIYDMRVRIALEEKAIKYVMSKKLRLMWIFVSQSQSKFREDLCSLDVATLRSDGRGMVLASMNPLHEKIPVLIHNGKAICEFPVIIQYIDEVWKDKDKAHLLPYDPYCYA